MTRWGGAKCRDVKRQLWKWASSGALLDFRALGKEGGRRRKGGRARKERKEGKGMGQLRGWVGNGGSGRARVRGSVDKGREEKGGRKGCKRVLMGEGRWLLEGGEENR